MKFLSLIKEWKLATGMIFTLALCLGGCVQVKTDPIKIEPIYIEITVNHKIQKELDDVFADIDAASETADFGPRGPTGN